VAASDPVVREVWIEATPEEVFPYFTKPELYLRWMGIAVELDPRPGGIFRVRPNATTTVEGEFVEVTPPKRLVFTWGHTDPARALPPGSTRVEVELIPRDGGTLVRLVHRDLAGAQRERHEFGWSHYLARLALAACGRDPGKDAFAEPAERRG
jgi:uncharacterized protein YndB with AHSA1/START domain